MERNDFVTLIQNTEHKLIGIPLRKPDGNVRGYNLVCQDVATDKSYLLSTRGGKPRVFRTLDTVHRFVEDFKGNVSVVFDF